MCRNIRTLRNFEPPAADEEARDAALQFVRKIAEATRRLLDGLTTNAPPKNREVEIAKLKERSRKRFAHQQPSAQRA